MNLDSISYYPTRTYKWGLISLQGSDGSILSQSGLWFKTKRLAEVYSGKYVNYVIAKATFRDVK